ncbi:MAG: rhodanese-like domain-containing protein [Vicinamibacterales bacterium]
MRTSRAQKTGHNGRHPLPAPGGGGALRRAGHRPGTQVVIYDGDTGMYAARAWWMLRWVGQRAAAVLDGGFAAWQRAGLPVSTDQPTWTPVPFEARVADDRRVPVTDVLANLGDASRVLVDARANDRFRGENETIDPVAGHIPGAVNRFFQLNLNADKTFKTPAALREEWSAICGGTDASRVVMYCGSGVTACHNLLALEHVGLAGTRSSRGRGASGAPTPTVRAPPATWRPATLRAGGPSKLPTIHFPEPLRDQPHLRRPARRRHPRAGRGSPRRGSVPGAPRHHRRRPHRPRRAARRASEMQDVRREIRDVVRDIDHHDDWWRSRQRPGA